MVVDMADESEGLTVDDLRVVEGVARDDRPVPCPVCGRRIAAGQDIATSLGDMRRGALGVTIHAACYGIVGRTGLLELMIAAYRQRNAP